MLVVCPQMEAPVSNQAIFPGIKPTYTSPRLPDLNAPSRRDRIKKEHSLNTGKRPVSADPFPKQLDESGPWAMLPARRACPSCS